MVRPDAYPITIRPKASFLLRVKLPFNCVNKEVYATMWDRARREQLLEFTISWRDRLNGRVDLSATAAQTELIKETGVWDFLVVDTLTNEKAYYIKGPVHLDLVVTQG